jgi:hypothetical protein
MKIYLLQMLMAAKRLYRRIANIYLARRARPPIKNQEASSLDLGLASFPFFCRFGASWLSQGSKEVVG